MKKYLALLLTLTLLLTGLTAGISQAEEKKISIVTTIFPIYDWVREIVGPDADNIDLTLLLDSGVDLHSYQPTVADIAKVSTSDLFAFVGGESDEWVHGALEQAQNRYMQVVNLVELMGDNIKSEEIVEGMEHEHDHDHDHDAHSKEVSTFEDDQVQDRSLKDWEGEWQSAYPYALDGTLDKGFEHKAESGKMTAEEYKAYYTKGYQTDLRTVRIDGENNVIEFTDEKGKTVKSAYEYAGYSIQDWSSGTRGAMYRFVAKDDASGAPKYIQFNDHIIEPCRGEHFHLRMSDTGFDDIEDPENRWPTFWPAHMTGEEILAAFIGHDHSHDDEDHDHEHEEEADEHVWLSLRSAQILCKAIADRLCEIDPANAEKYQRNLNEYTAKLAALDIRYVQTVRDAKYKTLLFGDRFPFRYLVDDYGLKYYAAFSGCSAESEASFQTIVFLAQKMDELKLPAVLTIEHPSFRIAETIVENTEQKNQKVLALDSLQSVTAKDVEAGVTYLSVMEHNLNVLKEALN